jgi:hypothetical protein
MARNPTLAMVAAGAVLSIAAWFAADGFVSDSGTDVTTGAGEAKAEAPRQVTMADRERAQREAIECMEAAGLEVEADIPTDGLRLATYITKAADPNVGRGITSSCRAKYSDPVERAWHEQRGTPTTAGVDALQARLQSCVTNGGVPAVADKAGAEAFIVYANSATQPLNIAKSAFRLYQQCAYQEETQSGMQAPYPWPGFEKLDWLDEVGP